MATLKIAIDAREAKAGAADAEAAMRKVGRGAQEADAGARGLQGSLNSLAPAGDKLKKVFAGVGASITAAFALNQAREAIGGYEQVMANLRAVTGATVKDMEAFDEASRTFGGGLSSFSPEEVANGLLNLAKAGFTAEQAIGAIGPALNLATAGDVQLAEATDTVAATLAQFRLGISDTGRVANTLVVAANASMASVQGVGEAMKYAGPLAAALGVSMEDTAAAISVLSNAGIQGSLAGTNLRGIMASLINPSREADAVLTKLGLTTSDVNVRTHGLVGALANLTKAGAGPAELEAIFGKLNVSAAIALGSMSKDFENIKKQIVENTTAAQDQARIMADTLPNAIKTFASTVKIAWINLGKSGLAGAMRDVVDFATGLVRALAGIETQGARTSATVQHVAIGIKAATAGLAAFAAMRGAVMFYDFGKAVLFSGQAFTKLNLLMAKNPIGLIAVVIALAVAAFLEFKDEVISVGDEFTTFGDIVSATWDFVVEKTRVAWTALLDTLRGAWKWIVDKFGAVVTWLGDKWRGLTEGMGVNWGEVFDQVLAVLKRVANIIIGTFVAIARVVGTIVDTVFKAAKAVADFDFDSPVESLNKIGEALDPKTILETATKKVKDAYAEDYIGALIGSITRAFNASKTALGSALDITAVVLGGATQEIARRAIEKTKTRTNEEDRIRKLREEADKAKGALDGLGRSAADMGADLATAGDAADEASKKVQQLREEIEREVTQLRRQYEVRNLSNDEAERALALADFRDRAMKAEVKDLDALVREYENLYDAVRLANAQRDEREHIKNQLDDMRNELSLVKLTNEEREREQGLLALTKSAKHLDAAETAKLAAEYEELIRQIQEARAAKQVADSISSAFGDAFEDVVTGAKSVGEALKGLFFEIQRELLRAIVIRPLVGSISSGLQGLFGGSGLSALFNAHGNAFSNGNLVPFAHGGHVTNGPEFFPLRGGRTGVRGESGDEGVLPLRRLANGDLGVQSDGGGGPRAVNVNMTVYAQDAGSFRRSQRQIAEDLRRVTGGGFSS